MPAQLLHFTDEETEVTKLMDLTIVTKQNQQGAKAKFSPLSQVVDTAERLPP